MIKKKASHGKCTIGGLLIILFLLYFHFCLCISGFLQLLLHGLLICLRLHEDRQLLRCLLQRVLAKRDLRFL